MNSRSDRVHNSLNGCSRPTLQFCPVYISFIIHDLRSCAGMYSRCVWRGEWIFSERNVEVMGEIYEKLAFISCLIVTMNV